MYINHNRILKTVHVTHRKIGKRKKINKKEKKQEIKWKINSKISVIKLNANGLNTSLKSLVLASGLTKSTPTQESHFTYNIRLEVKGWEKRYTTNIHENTKSKFKR